MSERITLKVEGLAELEARLVALGGSGARRALRRGLRAMGNVVRDAARDKSPVSTGTLRKSIVTMDAGMTPGGWSFSVQLRSGGFYGRFLEFGTSKMAAHPFMRPAAESAYIKAIEAFRTVASDAIEMEWMRRS